MFKRILIPTDGSTAANKTAKAGIALASRLAAKVVACYAVEELRPIFGPRLMVGQKMIDEVNQRTREVGQKHVDAIGRMAKAAGVPFGSLVTKVLRGGISAWGLLMPQSNLRSDMVVWRRSDGNQ
ncbi:MAG: hypothetical protein A3F74_06110 [Betaproteobacteria bacterium RIFCSPLOWO2_12_FULL_62_58]|nr:MAG: hypothetical protein A3F74_06110 [Betaproteobacteria bacterium RIFCSPLOWO2_12_FULL_62_58]